MHYFFLRVLVCPGQSHLGYDSIPVAKEMPLYLPRNRTFNPLIDTTFFVTYVNSRDCKTCGNYISLDVPHPTNLNAETFSFNTQLGEERVSLDQPRYFPASFGGIKTDLSLSLATAINNHTSSAPFDGVFGLA